MCVLFLTGLRLHAADNEVEIRCTTIMQTRADRVYCYATNKPFRVILAEPQRFAHGEVFIARGTNLVGGMVEQIPTLADAQVERTGQTNLPPPLRVTPGMLEKGDLNFYRVAMEGRVTSHEWMYFQNRHIEVVVLQGADRAFRLNILRDYSRARERLPVGTTVEVVGLSFLEVFAEPRGKEVQVDVENLDECRILRPAPWLTLDLARRGLLAGSLLAVFGSVWFWRERRQIARLRKAQREVRQLNIDLEKRIQERTGELAAANEQLKIGAEALLKRHKRSEEKAHRSEEVTRGINYFATSLLEQDNEDEILWDLAQKCVARLGFVDCVVYVLDRDRKVLFQKAAHGPKSPAGRSIVNPITIPVGRGIVGTVAETAQPEIIGDTRKDARYILDDEPRLSEIAVPIVVNGQVLGVIDSEHPEKNFFTQEHLEILTSIASLCANKLVRVRAERNLRQLNSQLEERVAARTAELAAANAHLKQAERELVKSLAQEKELGELKSRFVSMVSHEFRTPLAIIMSSAEILEAYLDRLPPEDRLANLKDIFNATRHMGAMVEEVLLLSRVEAGKLTCKPTPVLLPELCERLADEILSATNRRCPILFTASPNLPPSHADEGLLRHILMNLLDNAVKYSPPGSPVEFSVESNDHRAVFEIRDHGRGIPEADLRQLFQAFHRGGNVGETPGSGLGLVIVKSCVELHRGTISFETREGKGTRFTVSLPLFNGISEFSKSVTRTESTA